MQITADASKFSETVRPDLTSILNVLSESGTHFVKFSTVIAKKMLLVSHKMALIKNEAVFLCVTTRERARAYTAIIYNFCYL